MPWERAGSCKEASPCWGGNPHHRCLPLRAWVRVLQKQPLPPHTKEPPPRQASYPCGTNESRGSGFDVGEMEIQKHSLAFLCGALRILPPWPSSPGHAPQGTTTQSPYKEKRRGTPQHFLHRDGEGEGPGRREQRPPANDNWSNPSPGRTDLLPFPSAP